MSGSAGPTGSPGRPTGAIGPASPIVRWLMLLAGILLAVFGPDTSLGLVALVLGLALVAASLLWWMRAQQRGP